MIGVFDNKQTRNNETQVNTFTDVRVHRVTDFYNAW
ncbi:MAG: hypothetical protein JWR72_3259 [Flavisolibacter sp.]|jgi:hypothetical protein|nr:hypothetical protein [Flavisolibacter sp.]